MLEFHISVDGPEKDDMDDARESMSSRLARSSSFPAAAELLTIWQYFHITIPTALRQMWISSFVGAADTEIYQHHSPTTDRILQEFRYHGPWRVIA
jgi:hypothetical protein